MKNKVKLDALKEYEATILTACNVRRDALARVQATFEETKKLAKQVFDKALDVSDDK